MCFSVSDILWSPKSQPKEPACPSEKPPMAEAAVLSVQGSFPWMMEHAALGSALSRNQQELKNLSLVTWLSSPTGTQAMTPTAEISPCLKEGTRPLFLFFGLLDFQVQTWRCAQCNFSLRKFINCAPRQNSASRRGFTISKTLLTALF